ncbi:MAG: recombination regulator RecX [Clostridia bacterium]|nr:recombination regulator RecX [Clostridia bacterium]
MQQPISEEEQYRKAEVTAAGMLSRRPLSAAMLEKKLLDKDFLPEAAAYAVERMRILHAIDDHAYAELLLRSYSRKGYGILRIRQEMRQRGVPNDIIAEILEDFEPDWDMMKALLDRKLRGDVSDRKTREKAMAALQRRGFTFSQIRTVMEDYCADIADQETR